MTAVLLGINENRLAHFEEERASILLFSPSWVAHTYLQGPWRSSQHPHCVLQTVAAITTLMLMDCSWCDPCEQHNQHISELLPLALYYRALARGDKQQQKSREGTAKKIIIILYWKGAGNRNVDAAAWGQRHRAAECSQPQCSPYARAFATSRSLCATAIQNW